MPYLYSFEVALYKKLIRMVTFGAGLFVAFISALRLASLVRVDMTDVVPADLPCNAMPRSLSTVRTWWRAGLPHATSSPST